MILDVTDASQEIDSLKHKWVLEFRNNAPSNNHAYYEAWKTVEDIFEEFSVPIAELEED